MFRKHTSTHASLSVDVKTELQSMWMGSNSACELLPNQLVDTECTGHQIPYFSLQYSGIKTQPIHASMNMDFILH